MPKTVERDAAYVVQNVTYSELRPLAGAPADGDDYTYTPLPHRQPLIPPQWVSVSEYRSLVVEVQTLRDRVAELEKLLKQWQGD